MQPPIFTIIPRRQDGLWVFDDTERSLVDEPLISGTDKILEAALKKYGCWEGAHHGFRLDFAGDRFTEHGWEAATLLYPEKGGAWYQWNGIQGWLCPALSKYFASPPETIYFKVSRHPDTEWVNAQFRHQQEQFSAEKEELGAPPLFG